MEEALLIDCCGSFTDMELMESTDGSKLVKFRGKFQEAESVNKNKRMYPYSVLNDNVKRLAEAIKDRRLIGELDHPCLQHVNFQVLTSNGWKWFKEIREGDTAYSRVDGGMVESTVERIIDEPYDGKMIHVKGRSIDCTFTAPHKFLLCYRDDHRSKAGEQYYVKIEDIHANRTEHSHSYIPKTAKWVGNKKNTVKLKGVNRSRLPNMANDIEIDAGKFASFLGLYLSEGSLAGMKGSSNCVVIDQFTEYGKTTIRKLLAEFHSDIKWKENKRGFYTSDARLYDYLIPLGNKYNKYIPNEIKKLDSQYLEKLIVAFAIGDGRILKSDDGGKTCSNLKESAEELTLDNGDFTRMNVFTVSKQLIDDLHECLVKCGRAGSISEVIPDKDYIYAGRTIKAENKKPLYCLEICRSKAIHMDPRFLKTIETHHTGRIYCLKTEYGNFFMRYKGKAFWTGNCDSIVHFATASHLINRLYWDGNTLMGEGEILNTPHGKVLRALLNDGVKVGISSRGVGNGKVNESGVLVIGESYKLVTFDAVSDPSTHAAFQEKIVTDKRRNEDWLHSDNHLNDRDKKTSIDTIDTNIEMNINSELKNEVACIDTVSKEALIACLGGIVRTQTDQIRRGFK